MNFQLHMGRVKWFDANEGYGFISPMNGGDDIFVTRKSIANKKIKSLSEGQNVEFSVTRNSDGITAADVIAY
ncbi:cold shock domain-containing protein [Providencia stuartii]|uniref:Cold shock domain-containing protein n=2 Tax=Providencia TaxID=586 RepID=A0A1S1HU39_PROST|nr:MULTISPECIES: cold shock domain-containing protein [Providencia]MDV5225288.1 cold shock domain-containing protein [Providencia rettgeri]ELR5038632.1 cold shock domain-containing protein [Providencia stuartii]ELR5082892.1 cold shock domain-containing protein [Providencia stuartii]ELR5114303.1 cold shock domain-containing protein [Providencia stuartii]ELR5300537.1 cold shock domain-containing protein [Providencia stuartii]